MPATSKQPRRLSDADLQQLLELTKGADSVELKLTVPDAERRATITALGMDPLGAQIRMVSFFDTPDLTLNKAGVVVRARRVMHGKTSRIVHEGRDLFDSLPSPMEVMRYHSLVVARDTVPAELAVTAVGKELGTYDARYLGLATRICAELGADIVKTYHTDGFDSVVEAAMVPVVVAGGKRLDSVRDVLALASDAVTAGAAGIDFGRNVWQSDDPVATIQALRAVVHHGHGVADALGLYERLAGRPVPAGR